MLQIPTRRHKKYFFFVLVCFVTLFLKLIKNFLLILTFNVLIAFSFKQPQQISGLHIFSLPTSYHLLYLPKKLSKHFSLHLIMWHLQAVAVWCFPYNLTWTSTRSLMTSHFLNVVGTYLAWPLTNIWLPLHISSSPSFYLKQKQHLYFSPNDFFFNLSFSLLTIAKIQSHRNHSDRV